MRIVINISQYAYDTRKLGIIPDNDTAKEIFDAVRDGIVLPKGHGRLIDGDELESRMKIGYCIVKNAPTIIEADKGEKR